jgi:hypothetical protein
MSRLETLPPDLQAALSLLLRQRQGYAPLARMLGIEERAVHDRAHTALGLLAPRKARQLTAAQREQVGEYLLGQQSPVQQADTRAFLESSPAGRAWAQALATELTPLAGAAGLPEIPSAELTPAPSARPAATPRPQPAATPRPQPAATPRPQPAANPSPARPAAPETEPPASTAPPPPAATQPQGTGSSRTGGAILLGALAVVVIVAVVLIVSGGGSGKSGASAPKSSASTHSHHKGSTTTTGTTSTAGGSGKTSISKEPIKLLPPEVASSKAAALAYVLTKEGKHDFYLIADGLPPLSGEDFYAVWLENSPTETKALGKLPAEGSDKRIEGGGPLPTNAASFARIIVTSETGANPTHPGTIVLTGAFKLS